MKGIDKSPFLIITFLSICAFLKIIKVWEKQHMDTGYSWVLEIMFQQDIHTQLLELTIAISWDTVPSNTLR